MIKCLNNIEGKLFRLSKYDFLIEGEDLFTSEGRLKVYNRLNDPIGSPLLNPKEYEKILSFAKLFQSLLEDNISEGFISDIYESAPHFEKSGIIEDFKNHFFLFSEFLNPKEENKELLQGFFNKSFIWNKVRQDLTKGGKIYKSKNTGVFADVLKGIVSEILQEERTFPTEFLTEKYNSQDNNYSYSKTKPFFEKLISSLLESEKVISSELIYDPLYENLMLSLLTNHLLNEYNQNGITQEILNYLNRLDLREELKRVLLQFKEDVSIQTDVFDTLDDFKFKINPDVYKIISKLSGDNKLPILLYNTVQTYILNKSLSLLKIKRNDLSLKQAASQIFKDLKKDISEAEENRLFDSIEINNFNFYDQSEQELCFFKLLSLPIRNLTVLDVITNDVFPEFNFQQADFFKIDRSEKESDNLSQWSKSFLSSNFYDIENGKVSISLRLEDPEEGIVFSMGDAISLLQSKNKFFPNASFLNDQLITATNGESEIGDIISNIEDSIRKSFQRGVDFANQNEVYKTNIYLKGLLDSLLESATNIESMYDSSLSDILHSILSTYISFSEYNSITTVYDQFKGRAFTINSKDTEQFRTFSKQFMRTFGNLKGSEKINSLFQKLDSLPFDELIKDISVAISPKILRSIKNSSEEITLKSFEDTVKTTIKILHYSNLYKGGDIEASVKSNLLSEIKSDASIKELIFGSSEIGTDEVLTAVLSFPLDRLKKIGRFTNPIYNFFKVYTDYGGIVKNRTVNTAEDEKKQSNFNQGYAGRALNKLLKAIKNNRSKEKGGSLLSKLFDKSTEISVSEGLKLKFYNSYGKGFPNSKLGDRDLFFQRFWVEYFSEDARKKPITLYLPINESKSTVYNFTTDNLFKGNVSKKSKFYEFIRTLVSDQIDRVEIAQKIKRLNESTQNEREKKSIDNFPYIKNSDSLTLDLDYSKQGDRRIKIGLITNENRSQLVDSKTEEFYKQLETSFEHFYKTVVIPKGLNEYPFSSEYIPSEKEIREKIKEYYFSQALYLHAVDEFLFGNLNAIKGLNATLVKRMGSMNSPGITPAVLENDSDKKIKFIVFKDFETTFKSFGYNVESDASGEVFDGASFVSSGFLNKLSGLYGNEFGKPLEGIVKGIVAGTTNIKLKGVDILIPMIVKSAQIEIDSLNAKRFPLLNKLKQFMDENDIDMVVSSSAVKNSLPEHMVVNLFEDSEKDYPLNFKSDISDFHVFEVGMNTFGIQSSSVHEADESEQVLSSQSMGHASMLFNYESIYNIYKQVLEEQVKELVNITKKVGDVQTELESKDFGFDLTKQQFLEEFYKDLEEQSANNVLLREIYVNRNNSGYFNDPKNAVPIKNLLISFINKKTIRFKAPGSSNVQVAPLGVVVYDVIRQVSVTDTEGGVITKAILFKGLTEDVLTPEELSSKSTVKRPLEYIREVDPEDKSKGLTMAEGFVPCLNPKGLVKLLNNPDVITDLQKGKIFHQRDISDLRWSKNADGTYTLFIGKDFYGTILASQAKHFEGHIDMYVARIPTIGLNAIAPIRGVAFNFIYVSDDAHIENLYKNINKIITSHHLPLIFGSDFDVDKLFTFNYSTNNEGFLISTKEDVSLGLWNEMTKEFIKGLLSSDISNLIKPLTFSDIREYINNAKDYKDPTLRSGHVWDRNEGKSYLSVFDQQEITTQIADGKSMVGTGANAQKTINFWSSIKAVISHVLSKRANSKIPLQIFGDIITGQVNKNQSGIIYNLGVLISAATDVVKEMIGHNANLNTSTSNIWLGLIASGKSIPECICIMNNPIVRLYSRLRFDESQKLQMFRTKNSFYEIKRLLGELGLDLQKLKKSSALENANTLTLEELKELNDSFKDRISIDYSLKKTWEYNEETDTLTSYWKPSLISNGSEIFSENTNSKRIGDLTFKLLTDLFKAEKLGKQISETAKHLNINQGLKIEPEELFEQRSSGNSYLNDTSDKTLVFWKKEDLQDSYFSSMFKLPSSTIEIFKNLGIISVSESVLNVYNSIIYSEDEFFFNRPSYESIYTSIYSTILKALLFTNGLENVVFNGRTYSTQEEASLESLKSDFNDWFKRILETFDPIEDLNNNGYIMRIAYDESIKGYRLFNMMDSSKSNEERLKVGFQDFVTYFGKGDDVNFLNALYVYNLFTAGIGFTEGSLVRYFDSSKYPEFRKINKVIDSNVRLLLETDFIIEMYKKFLNSEKGFEIDGFKDKVTSLKKNFSSEFLKTYLLNNVKAKDFKIEGTSEKDYKFSTLFERIGFVPLQNKNTPLEQYADFFDSFSGYIVPTEDEIAENSESSTSEAKELIESDKRPVSWKQKAALYLHTQLLKRFVPFVKFKYLPETQFLALKKELGVQTDSVGVAMVLTGSQGKEIVFNQERLTMDAPLHEVAHLFLDVIRVQSPDEWRKLVGLAKQHPYWNTISERYKGLLKSDSDIADEVMAHIIGEQGLDKIENAGFKEIASLIYQYFLSQLKRFLNYITFGAINDYFENINAFDIPNISDMTLEQYSKVVYEQVVNNGVLPDIFIDEDSKQIRFSLGETPSKNLKRYFSNFDEIKENAKKVHLDNLEEDVNTFLREGIKIKTLGDGRIIDISTVEGREEYKQFYSNISSNTERIAIDTILTNLNFSDRDIEWTKDEKKIVDLLKISLPELFNVKSAKHIFEEGSNFIEITFQNGNVSIISIETKQDLTYRDRKNDSGKDIFSKSKYFSDKEKLLNTKLKANGGITQVEKIEDNSSGFKDLETAIFSAKLLDSKKALGENSKVLDVVVLNPVQMNFRHINMKNMVNTFEVLLTDNSFKENFPFFINPQVLRSENYGIGVESNYDISKYILDSDFAQILKDYNSGTTPERYNIVLNRINQIRGDLHKELGLTNENFKEVVGKYVDDYTRGTLKLEGSEEKQKSLLNTLREWITLSKHIPFFMDVDIMTVSDPLKDMSVFDERTKGSLTQSHPIVIWLKKIVFSAFDSFKTEAKQWRKEHKFLRNELIKEFEKLNGRQTKSFTTINEDTIFKNIVLYDETTGEYLSRFRGRSDNYWNDRSVNPLKQAEWNLLEFYKASINKYLLANGFKKSEINEDYIPLLNLEKENFIDAIKNKNYNEAFKQFLPPIGAVMDSFQKESRYNQNVSDKKGENSTEETFMTKMRNNAPSRFFWIANNQKTLNKNVGKVMDRFSMDMIKKKNLDPITVFYELAHTFAVNTQQDVLGTAILQYYQRDILNQLDKLKLGTFDLGNLLEKTRKSATMMVMFVTPLKLALTSIRNTALTMSVWWGLYQFHGASRGQQFRISLGSLIRALYTLTTDFEKVSLFMDKYNWYLPAAEVEHDADYTSTRKDIVENFSQYSMIHEVKADLFMNAAIFTAIAIEDGSWDAHEVVEGKYGKELIYDPNKDTIPNENKELVKRNNEFSKKTENLAYDNPTKISYQATVNRALGEWNPEVAPNFTNDPKWRFALAMRRHVPMLLRKLYEPDQVSLNEYVVSFDEDGKTSKTFYVSRGTLQTMYKTLLFARQWATRFGDSSGQEEWITFDQADRRNGIQLAIGATMFWAACLAKKLVDDDDEEDTELIGLWRERDIKKRLQSVYRDLMEQYMITTYTDLIHNPSIIFNIYHSFEKLALVTFNYGTDLDTYTGDRNLKELEKTLNKAAGSSIVGYRNFNDVVNYEIDEQYE